MAVQKKTPPFPHVDAANRYARDVVAGKILACKWVKLACQRHLDDLKKKDWPYRFDKKKAERVCKFIELLPHTKGQWAAKQETLVLSPWQVFVVCSIFGWVQKKTGLRRFREVYCAVPRKNGKSLLAAAIGLYCFAADGEFGAEVYSGATTEKQAWEIFTPARLIAKRTPDLCEEYGITVHAEALSIEENGSRFAPLIGNPGDGASPSCALIDEYHEHSSDALYETMATGMGARQQPLIFIITTAGSNLAGPCYQKQLDVQKILEGTVQDETIFAIIFTIDATDLQQNDQRKALKDEDTWTTEAALRKANPNFGVSLSEEYLRTRQDAAKRTARLQNAFKTKHLNLWVGAESAWMDMLRWNMAPARRSLEELAGRICFAGMDLSTRTDLTAVVFVFPPTEDDPLWHVHGRYYLPEDVIDNATSGNASHYDAWAKQGYLTLTSDDTVDYDVVKEDLLFFAERFQLRRLAYDDWNAEAFAQALVKLDPFKPRMVRGQWEDVVIKFPQTAKNFNTPMKDTEVLVRKRLLAHGHCPVMTWMMSNVVAHEDKNENIKPNKESVEKKIDGPVAMLMAISRGLLEAHQTVRSKYEEQGLTML